jgi:hypothetical protein
VNSGAGTLGGVSVVMVGKVTYDGHGGGQSTFTRSVAESFSGRRGPGHYTVKPDCGIKNLGGATDYDFVVTPDSRDIYWIVTNANSGALFANTQSVWIAPQSCMLRRSARRTRAPRLLLHHHILELAAIKAGSKVFYDQAAGISPGLLDSDVVLDAGSATGLWPLQSSQYRSRMCTYSSGTGQLAGFRPVSMSRRSRVAYNFHWDGTYSFSPEPVR